MKTLASSKRTRTAVAWIWPTLLCLLCSGCAFLKVREEVATLQTSNVLVGTVSGPPSLKDLPVLVAAYSSQDRKRAIVHHTTLHEFGPYELMVPRGCHNVVAFVDENTNAVYDLGEAAGQLLRAERSPSHAGGVVGNLDIVVSERGGAPVDLPTGTGMPPKRHADFHSTCPGAIARLDDPLFSEEHAKEGLWAGLTFFREIGGNVYFLEPYDPSKIPILFVHGVSGSPRNFEAFLESIDRSKYQPWFFYYPSGSSIDSMSHLLFWKLINLKTKYRFEELYITAHSMGGLVVRSFLVNYGRMFPSITTFVSISTPWGGEELAEVGVKYSPAAIPVWRDMQPGGEFIDSIYSKELPATVDYYLFFGHKGNRNILRPNTDKAVTLASQLDMRSQKDATMLYGFNEDHVSILSSEEVLSQYNAILADASRKAGAQGTASGNRLVVDFSFDLPGGLPKPNGALFLRSANTNRADAWVYLGPEDTGREHGPFPSGDYEVSIIATAFVPEPTQVPITIEEGCVPRARFVMKPAGFLRGYVADPEPSFAQAGKDVRPDTDVEIRSVSVRGNGVLRTVMPAEQELSYDDLYPGHYLSGTDFVSQGAFFFFGLPGGEYELSIDAEGYERYFETRNVHLGDHRNTVVVELEKRSGPLQRDSHGETK
jgi:triacylglycerol esterase/lipase EstA (alpha/beta hydrolase family)